MNESSLTAGMVSGVLTLFSTGVVLGVMILVCLLFSSKGREEPRSKDFSESFDDLLRKYDLVGKADLKKELNVNNMYRFTLLRKITHEAERCIPLPEGFIEEMRALVYEFYGDMARNSTKKELVFRVREQGMTAEEIHCDQEEWEYRCKVFWASYD